MLIDLKAARLTAGIMAIGMLAVAQEEPAPERIRFKKGTSAAKVQGTTEAKDGWIEPRAYLLGASAGQEMTVRFTADSPGAWWAVVCPGSGTTDGGLKSPWTFTLPETPGTTGSAWAGPGRKASPTPWRSE